MDKDSLIAALSLQPLAGEGGLWSPIYRDNQSNAINYMMVNPDFSAWHILEESELWIHVAGAPVNLYTIESAKLITTQLSREVGTFSYRVKPRTWMAAAPVGEWSLIICALTPPFSQMKLGKLAQLREEFPGLQIPELFHE